MSDVGTVWYISKIYCRCQLLSTIYIVLCRLLAAMVEELGGSNAKISETCEANVGLPSKQYRI